jgi:TM2 domain-containing membrane protein YozV
MSDATAAGASSKSRTVAALLAFFLGVIGVHRFYVGKTGTGIAQILTLGGLGLWTFIDFILILVGAFKDKDGAPVTTW